MATSHPLKSLEGFTSRGLPGKPPSLPGRIVHKPVPKSPTTQGFGHLARDGLHGKRVEKGLGQAHNLWEAGRVGCNDRSFAFHSLQGRKAEALMPGRKDKKAAQTIEENKILV
jgi:hypothetical protein